MSDQPVSRRRLLKDSLVMLSAPVVVGACERLKAVSPSPQLIARTSLQRRKADARGHADYGWLKARHSFSFGRYRDPAFDRFRSLRVLNEDTIAGSGGFPMHPHRDMEIVTYVLDGALQHRDSEGNGSVITPGEVQRMSAGTGIRHSEFNPSALEHTHLLQIWLEPDRAGHKPSYEQRVIKPMARSTPVRVIASADGREGSVKIHQDATIYACKVALGQQLFFDVAPGRYLWVQVARGRLTVNGLPVEQGDGVAVRTHGRMAFHASASSELLLFDLA